MPESFAIEMQGIEKSFGENHVLRHVDLSVKKGEIRAILGENGAGKTTLMNILYGFYSSDAGRILIHGKEVALSSPRDAIAQGIGMVHQHFMLVEPYTALQNIILGQEDVLPGGLLRYQNARKTVLALAEKYHFKIHPDTKIQDMTVGMQQRVEILKALFRGAEILILDEPTSVLTPQEIEELIGIMRLLADSGKTVLIITHKLAEIMKCADTCTVIRKGSIVDTVEVASTDPGGLAAQMVGREVHFSIDKGAYTPGEPLLDVAHLQVEDDRGVRRVDDVSFQVRRGEILGVAGVDGNGQQELFEAIASLRKASAGTICMRGHAIQNTAPGALYQNKISVIPEDRQKSGLVLDFTVAENLVLEKAGHRPYSINGVLNLNAIRENARQLVGQYDIRPEDCWNKHASILSGGNQQKAIIAREISNNPDLLIAVQPTRGLDVGAIEFVHSQIMAQRDSGKAVLLISFELDEIRKLSDRIAVMYNGRMIDIIEQDKASEKVLGRLMAGGKNACAQN